MESKVQTVRTIPNNVSDITIHNNNKKMYVIDFAISGERNVNKKEAGKILKCKDLTIEIRRMWNVKSKLIPVTTGAYLKIVQTILEPHTWKTPKQRTTPPPQKPYWAMHTL
jgi:hypothetical protein